MNFRSDNASAAHPKIMQALMDANAPNSAGYGKDDICQRAEAMIKDRFEAPFAKVYFVSTGTAANALGLSLLTPSWGSVYCAENAHINVDEAGAPEFFAGGCKLQTLANINGKISIEGLNQVLESCEFGNVHNVQPTVFSLTNVNEVGRVYSAKESKALFELAKGFGLSAHLDGARFANAVSASQESPAALSHQAGVDVLSFGGTKNGAVSAEAVIVFDEQKAWQFEMMRKRGGHLLSKGQFLGAQFLALMKDDLWLELAHSANTAMSELANGLQSKWIEFEIYPDANLCYFYAPRILHNSLHEAGASYFIEPATQSLDGADQEFLRARLVTSWATTHDEIETFLSYF